MVSTIEAVGMPSLRDMLGAGVWLFAQVQSIELLVGGGAVLRLFSLEIYNNPLINPSEGRKKIMMGLSCSDSEEEIRCLRISRLAACWVQSLLRDDAAARARQGLAGQPLTAPG